MLTSAEAYEIQSVLHVTNVPPYLLRRTRGLASVRRLAEEHRPQDLLARYREVAPRASEDPEAEAVAVAILVALATSDTPDAMECLRAIDPRDIPWGPEIRDIGLANPIASTSVSVLATPMPTIVSECA